MSDNTWKAGVAKVTITPAESMWMAGYAARRSPSSGVETDLFAKALVIEDPAGTRVVVLTCDLIAVSREIAEAVSREVERRYGLPRERLVLSTSHTHCGPEVRPSKVPFFAIPDEFARKIPGYVETLQEKWVAVIGDALSHMRPASLYVGRTSAGFGVNRREAPEFFDHDVPVLKVTGADGAVVAVLTSYACHNTTLRPEFTRFCGDYAGYAQAGLEREFPGALAMFMAGAGADQNPDPLGTVDAAKGHGHTLAAAVSQVLRGEVRPIEGTLAAALENVTLDFQPVPPKAELEKQLSSEDKPVAVKAKFLLAELERRGKLDDTYDVPLQVVRFGDGLTMIALPGEPVSDYAIMIRREFERDGRQVWVSGYCNDMFGYLPTVRVQRQNSYEGGRAMLWAALPGPWTETVEERVMAAARRLVASTSSGSRPQAQGARNG